MHSVVFHLSGLFQCFSSLQSLLILKIPNFFLHLFVYFFFRKHTQQSHYINFNVLLFYYRIAAGGGTYMYPMSETQENLKPCAQTTYIK